MAALRLNSLQGRWAHAIMSGMSYSTQPRLTRSQVKLALDDLGWTPLWDIALVSAIVLQQRARIDPLAYPRSQWASTTKSVDAAEIDGVTLQEN